MLKKITLICSLGLFLCAFSACTDDARITTDTIEEENYKDEEPKDETPEEIIPEEEIYYVRYASDALSQSYYYNISYTTEDGNSTRLSDIKADKFERTIGPVTSGFEAKFSIACNATNNTSIAIRIEVKKRDSPFVVKKESVRAGMGNISSSVVYTIE